MTVQLTEGALTLDEATDAMATPGVRVAPRGVRIDVSDLSRRVRDGKRGELTLLDAASVTILPGELVAIVGPSGAGKTTFLEAIAGIAPATSGSVRFDGIDVHANLGAFRSVLGYVPQDDIIHADLPLVRTLRYAARLRLPSSTSSADVEDAVRDALIAVGLAEHADVRVGSLSGGQRKRASIAVELLTDPHVFFLDEPTSGLDPLTSAELIARLRQLADRSATVVFTTHSVDDLARCDRIVFMARGGRVGFVGTVDEALDRFQVSSVPELYRRMADPDGITDPDGVTYPAGTVAAAPAPDAVRRAVIGRPVASGLTQWAVLTRRTLEILVRNRLTLAILVGSPALVVAMFAILFRPGAFDFEEPSPSSMVMIGFWVVFAAFFFGLTYGLLQICTERTILRRERLVGLRPGAYVASKVTVLAPFLLLVVGSDARCAPGVGPPPQSPTHDVRLDRGQPAAVRIRRPRPRPAHLRHGRNRRSGDARPSDVVLPRRAVLRCHPSGQPHGERRRRSQRGDAVALGLRGHRPRPRSTPHPRRGRLTTRAPASRVVRRRGHLLHRHLLARPRSVQCHVPRRHLGGAGSEHQAEMIH